MLSLAGKSVSNYGLDQTGKIVYKFDQYGFREGNDYNTQPNYIFFGASILAGIGVDQDQRFSMYMEPSWNFGLCGSYTENEIVLNYFSFMESYKLQNNFKIIFCWKNSNIKELEKLMNSVPNNENIFHCVPVKINRIRTCRYLENIDNGACGIHWGATTHKKFAKLLCQFLK